MRHSFLVLFAAMATVLAQSGREIPPAFGPHIQLAEKDFAGSATFTAEDRVVLTYYFYWYDAESRLHILDHRGLDYLTTHPPTLEGFSFKAVKWHREQLEDMIEAGIDVVLPVFWGAPSEHDKSSGLHWSYEGLPPLVQAREELLRAGRKPPRIGLFYDTSTLQYNRWGVHVDLTSDYGRRWFHATVRDFFSMIPAKHWAMVDGQPLVFLYSAAFAKNHDQALVDFVGREFKKEFAGRVPYIVREVSWDLKTDNVYAWGGALGLKNPGGVAALGPGYDHTNVRGREPLIVGRDGGSFYEENWIRFLRAPTRMVALETWNEFHEGTDICESKEHGRQYIELTRKYVDLFKQGWKPAWPAGAFTGVNAIMASPKDPPPRGGLRRIEHEDGRVRVVERGGVECWSASLEGRAHGYIYFRMDDSFKWNDSMDVEVEVEHLDTAAGKFSVEYDGSDSSAPLHGAYTRSGQTVSLEGDQRWKVSRFPLPRARFLNSQNSGADFRLTIEAPEFILRKVTVRRTP